MTLFSALEWVIPTKISRVTRAVFLKRNAYMMMRYWVEEIFTDSDRQTQFKADDCSPAFSSEQLALITVMQFVEQLTDQQAAAAVRSRTDWQSALGLKSTYSKFDASGLSGFRQRLIAGGETQLLDDLLAQLEQRGWIGARGISRIDLPHLLETICLLNRIEHAGETLRHALNHLAIVAPEWLLAQVNPDWFDRYGTLLEQYCLPKAKIDLQQLVLTIGRDAQHLLSALDAPHTPEWLQKVPSVEVLRSMWTQQYQFEGEKLIWRVTLAPKTLTE